MSIQSIFSRWMDVFRKYGMPNFELCSALDSNAQPELFRLNEQLSGFYNSNIVPKYFDVAESKNAVWRSDMKAHWHLKNSIPKGSRVVDLGCGTATPCRNMIDRQIHYTGIDWSQEQVLHNQRTIPNHTFIVSSLYETPLPDHSFDVAISLYVIEHLVWPHRLLDEMHRLVRPGGLIAILSPPFRIKSYLKSFDYGLSARPFKDKIKSGLFLDATLHFFQHRIAYPIYINKHYPRESIQGQFLINLKPICLQEKVWFPDADAVYLTDAQEILAYLTSKGTGATPN